MSEAQGFGTPPIDVEETNATAADPRVIMPLEANGMLFHNRGATELTVFELPEAKEGRAVRFFVHDSDGLKVVCKPGDKIVMGGTAGVSGGFISSTTSGDWLFLVASASKEWLVQNPFGGWTFDV